MNARVGFVNHHEDLDRIERQLRGTLRPVVPPRELVRRLQGRIRLPDASELRRRLRDWQTLWLVLVGALSGTLMILTVARALFHITSRREGSG